MKLLELCEQIEAAAKEATPGPWTTRPTGMVPENMSMVCKSNLWNLATTHNHTPYISKRDAEYVALCNPKNVLKLTHALRIAVEALETIAENDMAYAPAFARAREALEKLAE